jgi:hypothetical protein
MADHHPGTDSWRLPSAPTRTIRTHVLAPHTPQARHSRRTSRARPSPYRSAPRVRGCRRARRSARVPPAPSTAALAPAAAARSGAGTSAALHRPAGPQRSLQPRARRPSLTLGGRPAARSAAPGLDLRVPAGRRSGPHGRSSRGEGRARRSPAAPERRTGTKSSPARSGARCEVNRRRPTLPGPCGPSTIGAEGLNCSVRNGKRCFPLAIATGNWKETTSAVLQNCTEATTAGNHEVIRQALDRLVPVSSERCRPSRAGLSTWWSTRGLTPSRGWESSS